MRVCVNQKRNVASSARSDFFLWKISRQQLCHDMALILIDDVETMKIQHILPSQQISTGVETPYPLLEILRGGEQQ